MESTGLRAQLRLGGERPSAMDPRVTTDEAGREYRCLSAIQLLHGTLRWGAGGGKMNGEDNVSSSSVCKWSVRRTTPKCLKQLRDSQSGQDSAHFTVRTE